MLIAFDKEKNLLKINKPRGFCVHSPVEGRKELCELLGDYLKLDLRVIHRLDKDTTGTLIFGIGKDSTALAAKCFFSQDIEKKYLLLTKSIHIREPFEIKSSIKKVRGKFISVKDDSGNAHTKFRFIKAHDDIALWEAHPLTGRTHQIRLHANDGGIPILGDTVYGGASFPGLMLHAKSISLPEPVHCMFDSPESMLMSDLSLCKDHELAQWVLAWERRSTILQFSENECVRILHREDPQLRIDKFGGRLCVYWYHSTPPSKQTTLNLERLCDITGAADYTIFEKTRKPAQSISLQQTASWPVHENGVFFEARTNQGFSPGLFPDQRRQRRWVRQNSQDKSVLNLFSYTSMFSVVAALGHASKVCSVDISKAALSWSKQNFIMNGLDPHQYLFFALDARDYLKRAIKRSEQWDIIVCDPPSFARTSGKVFSLQKELKSLLQSCMKVLKKEGTILYSCNLEKISIEKFTEIAHECCPTKQWTISIIESGLDYEIPSEEPLLKSLIIRRRDSAN